MVVFLYKILFLILCFAYLLLDDKNTPFFQMFEELNIVTVLDSFDLIIVSLPTEELLEISSCVTTSPIAFTV